LPRRPSAPEGASLFDRLVGAADQGNRHGDAERFGGRHIDVELDLGRLLNGQVGGLLASENPPRINPGKSMSVGGICSIANKPAAP